MIIIKLQGGLGNQMFQYALGQSLSLRHEQTVKFDCSYFKTPNQSTRSFELGGFNLTATEATESEIAKYRGTIQKIFELMRPKNLKKCFIEQSRIFDPAILEKTDGYFDGHWNSEKYFIDYGDELKKDFTLKNPFGTEALAIREKIKTSQNAVSVHVRRGDYVTIPKINQAHGTLPLSYYQTACKKILETTPDAYFFVSSDDIDWVKENFPKDYPVTFVSSPNISNCEEMVLMGKCKHNIIANSTFSWWSAWLNQNPQKIVIAPKQWFRDPSRLAPNLIPQTWIQL